MRGWPLRAGALLLSLALATPVAKTIGGAVKKKPVGWAFWADALRGECALCGMALRGHPRCNACGILVGNSHAATEMVGGLCGSCAKRRQG
jgi:hypothetical protein